MYDYYYYYYYKPGDVMFLLKLMMTVRLIRRIAYRLSCTTAA